MSRSVSIPPLIWLSIVIATLSQLVWSQPPESRSEVIRPSLVSTRPGHHWLIFHTRDHAFYAQLFSSQPDHHEHYNCTFFHGRMVAPSSGYVAITTCPDSSHHKQPTIYSTIILDSGDTYVIRSHNHTTDQSGHGKILIDELNDDDGDQEQVNTTNHRIYQLGQHHLYRISRFDNSLPQCQERFIDDHESHQVLNRIPRDTTNSKTNNLANRVFEIETIIFVDNSLVRRFNGSRRDLQKLILAIMNEVQLIYNFDSMKTRIRIIIKKIVYLDSNRDAPDSANGDIDQYLDNFCAWQKRLWQKSSKRSRWDHALMLTGLDLYKQLGQERNKKVLGLAWVNGMCKPSYSCTLNEGKNFEAAFVIAHEMAHSLGMLHDGYDNNCDPDRYIMSEKTGPGKIHWSQCSNLYLENFLTKTNLKCLEKSRNTSKLFSNSLQENEVDAKLPGEQYSLNQQCQLALGNHFRAYHTPKSPFNNVCQELWCFAKNWASPAHPALEGSHCGPGKACFQGSCVSRQHLTSGSKLNSMVNRHRKPPKAATESEETTFAPKATSGSSSSSSFMRKVQRFLRNTIGSIANLFG